jgi:hypothetical protein
LGTYTTLGALRWASLQIEKKGGGRGMRKITGFAQEKEE